MRVVVIGQGYVGLPLAMRAVEVGFDVVGLRSRRREDRRARSRPVAHRRHHRRRRGARAGHGPVPGDVVDWPTSTGSTSPSSPCRRPLREGVPDLSYIESAVDAAGRVTSGRAARWCWNRRRTRARPTSCVAPVLEDGVGPEGRRRLPRRVLARADRPGQPGVGLRPHAEGRLGHRRLSRCAAVQAFYDRLVDRTVPVSNTRAGGADQAAGEHVPPREHRAGERAGDPRERRSGIDIWEVIEAAGTKPFGFMPVLARPGCGRPLPADRPELPVVEDRAAARYGVAVRRHGQRHQQPDARLRGAPGAARPERAPARRSTARGSWCSALSYKKNSNDARETPATGVIEGLLELGAEVHVHDDARSAAPARRAWLTRSALTVGRAGRGRCRGVGHRSRRRRLRPRRGARRLRVGHPEPAAGTERRAALTVDGSDLPQRPRRRPARTRVPAASVRRRLDRTGRPRPRRVRGRDRAQLTGLAGRGRARQRHRRTAPRAARASACSPATTCSSRRSPSPPRRMP